MASDLEGPNRMAEIAPDGGSIIDRELSRVLKGFGICLTAMVEKERIHDVTEETNQRNIVGAI